MNFASRTLVPSAAACLVAMATPVLAQNLSAPGYHPKGAPPAKMRRAEYAVPASATAEVGDSSCRLEIFHVVGITQPNYTTMCGPR